ncbi:MAG: hypothetical protein AAF546_00220 [Verrucomicrobiota bacterium]
MLNSKNYTVAAPTVTLPKDPTGTQSFVLVGDYTEANPSSANDVVDGSGDHDGSIYTVGKRTASMTVRNEAGNTDKPLLHGAFDYEGNAHLIIAVNRTVGGSTAQQWSLELEVTGATSV